MSLFGTNVAAFTKKNAWLIKLGCPLTESVMKFRVTQQMISMKKKKKDFLVAQAQK